MAESASLLHFDISWLLPLQFSFYYARQFHHLAGGGIARHCPSELSGKVASISCHFSQCHWNHPLQNARTYSLSKARPLSSSRRLRITWVPEWRAILNGLLRNWDFKRKRGETAKQICNIIDVGLCLLLLWSLYRLEHSGGCHLEVGYHSQRLSYTGCVTTT